MLQPKLSFIAIAITVATFVGCSDDNTTPDPTLLEVRGELSSLAESVAAIEARQLRAHEESVAERRESALQLRAQLEAMVSDLAARVARESDSLDSGGPVGTSSSEPPMRSVAVVGAGSDNAVVISASNELVANELAMALTSLRVATEVIQAFSSTVEDSSGTLQSSLNQMTSASQMLARQVQTFSQQLGEALSELEAGRALARQELEKGEEFGEISSHDSNGDLQVLKQNLATAEGMIDAFYSFDAERLRGFLTHAGKSAKRILYYQGWANGGNYKVLNRGACAEDSERKISCPITVQDDPVMALQTGFMVTDTFTLTFEGNNIVEIDTSSNDQPIYYEARAWVADNMPEVMTGPCKKHEDGGGPSPEACARAMTEGYRQFMVARGAQ